MADPTARLSPGELQLVRNASARKYLQEAFRLMILAGTHFMTANQDQHDEMTHQICEDIRKLMGQVKP